MAYNANDTAKVKDIISLAQYASAKMDSITGGVLDSVPSTVDGGLWYETTSTAPIIKFKQGGSTYYLYTNQLVSPNLTLSSSTVTATSGANQTVTLTYSGEGTITLSNPNETALTATYNASTKTITLTSNLTSGDDPATVNLGVALSEAGNYAADSQTLAVTCTAQLLDPQLKLNPTESTAILNGANATTTVSYSGNGTISVPSSCTYNSSTKVISASYYNIASSGSTFNISLSAAGEYNSATAIWTVWRASGGGSDVN